MLKIATSRIADLAYYGLCISIFFSLNSLTAKYFGVSQVASPLILFFCITIFLTAKIKYYSFKYIPIKLMYAVFFSYYFIGLLVRLGSLDMEYRVTLFSQFSSFVTSIIIILAIHQYFYYKLVTCENEKMVFNGAYIPILLSLLYSVYEYKSGAYLIEGTDGIQGRTLGVFGNPNELGVLANIGLLFSFYSLYAHKNYYLIKICAIILALFVSFLSLSRASLITSLAIIIILIVLFFVNYFRENKSIRHKIPIISGLSFLFISYLIFNFEKLLLKYTDYWQAKKIMTIVDLLFKGKISTETTSERSMVAEYAIEWIKHSPIFGNGLGFFAHFPISAGFDFGVHNTYLLILGDAGILAFLIFVFFIIYMLFKSFFIRNTPISFLVFGCFIIFALQSLSGHNGLSDKTFNILITIAVMYLIYGISLQRKNY